MKKKKLIIIDILILFALLFVDQLTKYIAVINLKDKPNVPIIKGVLELSYLENRGAAFGIMQNQKLFFIIIAIVFLLGISYLIFKMPDDQKYFKLHILLIAIGSGAIGNLIDRVRLNYVIDFIYFSIINFPVFNFADICVTLGTIILILLILFVYKDDELSFFKMKES